ncbi:hypothetical protein CFT12S00416_05540 [Campylobacter fetus subsp. testudinum]|uniref:hypothetical protein n=1 Tax=Campylobacter fetus TaxID=196 RepID=UPI00081889EF|nr:hypothetical protein [Campylobacter fetus]OCR88887.1 hypothetical protein CFT12S00416_05540 [Campylobacter fetus subsp. testudinum]
MEEKKFSDICLDILNKYDGVLAISNVSNSVKNSVETINNSVNSAFLEIKDIKSSVDKNSLIVAQNTNISETNKDFIEQKAEEFKSVITELRNLRAEIGDISLKNIIDNVISDNASSYFETSLDTLLDRAKYKEFISKAKTLYDDYKDELESLSSGATNDILNLKNSASASLSEIALSSKNDITSSTISAKTELKAIETTIKSGFNELKNDVFNAADEKRELVNKSILEANAVINRVIDSSYLEQVQQVVNVGAWERVLLNINLLDITFIKATNMAYERDTTNIRNEVALMMQEVESDRVEIAKLKADSKEFLERSVSAASIAEWNSYLEVI